MSTVLYGYVFLPIIVGLLMTSFVLFTSERPNFNKRITMAISLAIPFINMLVMLYCAIRWINNKPHTDT